MIGILIGDMLWAGLAAMGFAILFNVPKRTLIYCVVGGALGHGLRTLIVRQFGLSIELATLIGATAVGFWASYWAYRLKLPAMVLSVSAAIPMVPGVFAYQTMIGILQLATLTPEAATEVLGIVAVNAVKTGLILAALAVGIVAPNLLFPAPQSVK